MSFIATYLGGFINNFINFKQFVNIFEQSETKYFNNTLVKRIISKGISGINFELVNENTFVFYDYDSFFQYKNLIVVSCPDGRIVWIVKYE